MNAEPIGKLLLSLDTASHFVLLKAMTTQLLGEPLKIKVQHGKHPNTLKNLAKGRARLAEMRRNGELTNPTGYSLTADIKHELQQEAEFISPTARPKDKLWREQIKRAILVGAARGEVPMVKEVWDRVDGKVKEETPPPAPGSQILNIIVVGGGDNLSDILTQVKERTKKLAIGEG